jgi:dihydroorotate dehydrogenase electron transfer subunit
VKQAISTVVANTQVSPGVHLLWVDAPEIAAAALAGQYVMLRCGEGDDLTLRRPLSIHRVTRERNVAFLFAAVGKGTDWLSRRRQGDRVDLFGPLGNGFHVAPSSGSLLLVAGGMGVAPLAALADQAIENDRPVTILYGAGTASGLCADPKSLPGVESVVVTEDGSAGETGLVTDLLPRYAGGADQVFACGPLTMYRRMAGMSRELSGKPTQVLLEVVMGCGVGACLGCSIETAHGQRLVCKDGPVFELSEIVWDKMTAPPTGRRCSLQPRVDPV